MNPILYEIEPVAGCRQFQLRGDDGHVHGYVSQVITPYVEAGLQICCWSCGDFSCRHVDELAKTVPNPQVAPGA